MFRRLIETDNSAATTILRIVLGVVLFSHGAQNILGGFCGYGFMGTIGFFATKLHIPAPFAVFAIAAEFFGALGLIFGVMTRVAAFGIAVTMIVAVAVVHAQFGFFANWSGMQKGEGYEYHLLALAIAVFLFIKGAGAASIDRTIMWPRSYRRSRITKAA